MPTTPGIGRLAGVQFKQVYPWSNLVPTTLLLACTPETSYASGRQDTREPFQSFFFGDVAVATGAADTRGRLTGAAVGRLSRTSRVG